MDANAQHERLMWSVSYFEFDDGAQQRERHGGDFSSVLVFIADRKATHDHVGVPNGLHFVHVVISNDRVEARIEIVQEIHHLNLFDCVFGQKVGRDLNSELVYL
jgi:hypothetical protein